LSPPVSACFLPAGIRAGCAPVRLYRSGPVVAPTGWRGHRSLALNPKSRQLFVHQGRVGMGGALMALGSSDVPHLSSFRLGRITICFLGSNHLRSLSHVSTL